MKPTPLSCRLVPGLVVLGLGSCVSAPEPAPAPAGEEPQAETPESAASEATAPAVARAEIETLEFRVEIAAPVEEVWEAMLSPEGYREWTKPFLPGSYFQGSWAQGERMHFLAPGGSGMVAVIAANRPGELLSIEHIGFVMNGVEDTASDAVRSWAPAYETYRFAAVPGGTRVTVEHEVFASHEAYMNGVWPRALAALKALCEADGGDAR